MSRKARDVHQHPRDCDLSEAMSSFRPCTLGRCCRLSSSTSSETTPTTRHSSGSSVEKRLRRSTTMATSVIGSFKSCSAERRRGEKLKATRMRGETEMEREKKTMVEGGERNAVDLCNFVAAAKAAVTGNRGVWPNLERKPDGQVSDNGCLPPFLPMKRTRPWPSEAGWHHSRSPCS